MPKQLHLTFQQAISMNYISTPKLVKLQPSVIDKDI